jgi:hypothetical protein
MPFLGRAIQQCLPGGARFIPLASLEGECPFVIIGELRGKFFRQRISGFIIGGSDELPRCSVLGRCLGRISRLDPAFF